MGMPKFRLTQLSFASEVKDWINDIIKRLGLRFEYADIEVEDPRRKRADVILWERRPVKPALLIEIWDARTPIWDARTPPYKSALDLALSKAWKNNIPYFAIWNLTHFYCWATFEKGDVLDKLWWPHSGVSEIVCDAITYDDAILKYSESIKKHLEIFLKEFEQVYYGVKTKPSLGIDERFIYRLRGTIHALSIPIFESIKRMAMENMEFRRAVTKFFGEQGWSFKGVDEDFDKVSRQHIYLLVNKILFYNVLRSKYGNLLPKIVIPETDLTGSELKNRLDNYFKRAYEIAGNFETILLTDFLDSIIPPDEVVSLLKDFIHKIGEYDFSKINYEILGNIFQRLIPENERHKLGQYYTRSDVVGLIVGFCVRNADDKVLDGACGAGTFLIRSYVRKKLLNPRKAHRELLEDLYGVDIAKFPAHLSMINLASRDLSEIENHPNIIQRDFFDILPANEYFSTELRIETLSGRRRTIKMSKEFDVVVMNPPYTRQEEIEDILEEEKSKAYKRCIEDWKTISRYPRGKKPKLSKRSSIYVYFFIHGGYFLKEGGRLGLITSNSWLDADYGRHLQRFFLENFKIKAIIESKVEKWFEDPKINTAITILEKCFNPEERNNNLVKFVQLKRPLTEFIPPTEDEKERWTYVEKVVKFIDSKECHYEDDKIRIFTKKQKELWEEGYDEEKKEYVGSKWGKYIRAPDIFFKVLMKGPFIPLRMVAKIGRGLRTGCNDFFYLNEDKAHKLGIINYVKPVIKSPKDSNYILLSKTKLKNRVFTVNVDLEALKGTKAYEYIKLGEREGVPNKRSKRERWWSLDEECIDPDILIPVQLWETHKVFYKDIQERVFFDQQLSGIKVDFPALAKVICAFLNSTLGNLFLEVIVRRQLGEGSLQLAPIDLKSLPVLNPLTLDEIKREKISKAFDEFCKREIFTVFEEIGVEAQRVLLDKVRPERKKLDKVIMDEVLNLTEEEQLEVYRSVVDLVRSRIEMAKSGEKNVVDIDIDELVNSVLKDVERFYGIQPRRFPEDYISECPCRVIEVPNGSKVETGFDLEGPYVKIDDVKIRCSSIYEAKFIEYAVLAGKTRISIPLDEDVLRNAVEERGKLIRDAKTKIKEFLNETMVDRKLREKVRFETFRRLGI
jgi:type I restriction-modification system DNA methylase subunit